MNTTTRSIGSDVTLVVACAIGLVSSVLQDPFQMADKITTIIFSILIGIGGTTAVLKHKGVIQFRQRTPEEDRVVRRTQVLVLAGLIMVIAGLTIWNIAK